jgi:WhiB family redox-sensing transcriptional regulator
VDALTALAALMAAAPGHELPDLPLAAHRPDWHRHAACRGHDPALWFPERGQSAEPARTICAGCPVQHPCHQAGLEGGAGYGATGEVGIWGGTSGRQRRALLTNPAA